MTRLIVEAGFGYTVAQPASIVWTDISQYVDVVTGVSIGRGASDEVSEIQPATCSMVLDDSDGRFTPGRATSPYWPSVRKNTPIRVRVVSVVTNLMTNPSFESGVTEWTSSGIPTRAQSTTHVQAGTYAMLITWGAAAGQNMKSPTIYGLTIGQVYTLSAYVWVPSGNAPVQLALTGGAIGSQSTVVGAFQRITVTFTATSTSHQVQVRVAGTPTVGDQVWVDACQIEVGGAATTFDPQGAQIHDRFYGMVNEWPLKLKGLQATTSIVCTDLFKWLSGQPSLQPILSEEILYSGALAYYPLSEDSSATSAGDLAANGARALAIAQMGSGGPLAFAGATGPAETGLSAPLFTPASASAGQYLKADLGPAAATATGTQAGYIELWIQTSTTGRTFLALATADGAYQVVYGLQASTGLLEMRYTLDPTAAIADWGTGVDLSSGNLADGKLHHLVIGLFTADLWVDGVSSNLPFGSKQPMRTMYLGGFADGRLWSGAISNVALYASSGITGTTLASHYNAGATGYAGEDADTRIQRLAKYIGITTVTPLGITFDSQASQGPGGSTALSMMQAVATTESARLFASRDSFGLTLMSRDIRYNPVADVSLSYPDLNTDDIEHSDDDQKMVNSVVASRPGGATQRVISQASIDAYGPKEQQLDLLKTSDNSVLDAANWLISRYADPPPELREIPVEAYTLGTTTYRNLLGLGISSVLTVTDLPDQAPAPTQTVFIEGYTETIRQNSHLISFHASRSYNDSAWVLDDPTYSTLGSTTKLAY